MFNPPSFRAFTLLTIGTLMLSGCAIAPGYTDSEKEIKQQLSSSKFQPASREMRDNIETQELFAQAAFWSREYELNPGDLESAIKLSASVRKLGNAQRAVEIAQTSRALYPRDPYLTAEFAAGLIASERAHEAIKPLDNALRSAPGYARLWSLKGAALDQQENYDLARKHYARAMKITPNDPNIMANVGLSFALSGDPQTAEKWLRRAVSIPGSSQSVRQNLALILQLQGKEAEATKYSSQTKLRRPTATPIARPAVQQRTASAPSYSPSSSSAIPASERGNPYKQNFTQPKTQRFASQQPSGFTIHEGRSLAGAPEMRKSSSMTVSDAARLAAQRSRKRKITLPLDGNTTAPTVEQSSVLDQIARNIGPQSNVPRPSRSLQANSNLIYSSPQPSRPQTGGYPTHQQQPRPYQVSAAPQRRSAARSRR